MDMNIPFEYGMKTGRKASSRPIIDIEEINKTNGVTPRVLKLKQDWMNFTSLVSSDRGYAYMESWKETEGEHESVRIAKMFRNWAETVRVSIHDGELLVGGITHWPRGSNPRPETEPVPLLSRLKQEHEKLHTVSLATAASIEEYDLARLEESCEYFKNYFEALEARKKNQPTLAHMNQPMQDTVFKRAQRTPIFDDTERARWTAFWAMGFQPKSQGEVRGLAQPPIVLGCDYERVLKVGFNGLIKESQEHIERIIGSDNRRHLTPENLEKVETLRSFIIALEGMITYARRHAALAREKAAAETDPQRKQELLKIADVCEWVPANPARDFQESLQVQWFILVGQEIEKCSSNAMMGRIDQYCYPYYEKSIESGQITHQEAAELLGCLMVKWQTLESFTPWGFQRLVPGSYIANVNVGGVDKHGKDASNELSCLVLHVMKDIKTNQPHVSLRYHPAMAPELMMKALECTRDHGGGIPAWFNDKVTIEYLLDRGIPMEEARDGVILGCVNIGVQKGYTWDRPGGPSFVNHAKLLELALNNGVDPYTGFKLGPATGDSTKFTSFEQLEEAYRQQIVSYIDSSLARYRGLTKEIWFDNAPYTPFTSPLNDNCIEKGKDLHKGGMRYYDNLCGGVWIDRAQADTTDSLLAIKELVFDSKQVAMAEMLEALKANFEGHEKLRAKCLAAPKWGNDNEEVDSYHNKWWDYTVELSKSRLNFMGNRMAPHRQGAGWAALNGRVVNALPSGRLAGTPLSDGAASPSQGADIKGPTATLNSVAKMDPDFVEAPLLNMRFTPGPLKTKDGLRKFGEMIRSFFEKGAAHVQFTILDRETLIEAKKNPENYRNLVVRVAGYSAFWVDLTPDLQDEIISRTQHTV